MRRTITSRRSTAHKTAGFVAIALAIAFAPATATPAGAAGTNPNQTVDTTLSPTQLAQMLVGPGVAVSNVQYTGGSASSGAFSFTDASVVGFNSGLIMSSGNAADVVGPNTQDDLSGSLSLPGDPDLTALSGFDTFDAAVLEFDFVPTANQVTFQYAFGSEEYPEWVGSPFNDVFAFFVNGTNYATVREVAGDPASAFVPVAVNRIDDGNPIYSWAPHRPDLFRPNYYNPAGASLIDLEADGITTPLTFQSPVNPGVTNHMKLAISDASDPILDSTVFIQAGSLVSNENPVADLSLSEDQGNAPLSVTAFIEGEDPNGLPLTYSLNWGDGTAPATGSLPGETAQATHTYTQGGHFTATLTVSNGSLTGVSHEDVTVFGTSDQGPQVTTTPTDQTVAEGEIFTFTASASGVPEPDVQWQQSADGGATFTDIPAAAETTYSNIASGNMDGYQYRAVFTNNLGEATTDPATLHLTPAAPSVTTQPTDQTVDEGSPFTFTTAASGVPVPTVQWQESTDGGTVFTDIVDATDLTYSGTATLAMDGQQFRAVFSNEGGIATTDAATLQVTPQPQAPSVTTQPTDQTVDEGSLFTFTAAASGVPAPTVKWQVSTNGGSSFTDIAGATATTYSSTATFAMNGYRYRAVFSNGSGDATTTAAVLNVHSLDTTPPLLSPTMSATSPFLRHASGIVVNPNASDPESGITSSSCTSVDTATIGSRTVTCTATNGAGLTTTMSVPYSVGFGLSSLSPADNSTVKRAASLSVSFKLVDALGVLSPTEANTIKSGVRVAWDGNTPVTATWNKKTNTFSASLKMNKPLAGSTHHIAITVTVGSFTAVNRLLTVTIG